MRFILLLILLGLYGLNVFGQALSYQIYKTGFSSPVDITNAGDSTERLFVVEKAGRIKILDKNKNILATPFLSITSKVSSTGERGLLGLAFHPDYKNNGYFFINYTNTSGNTVIARYNVSANANVADATSEKILLTINQPYSNHNGGCLKFNPMDGYLYIGMGDGGSGGDPDCYGQDSTSLLGKMLRLDINQNINTVPYHGIPSTNPYLSDPNYRDEIWAVGLRNPWRFSFDRKNGDMWIGDVGQNVKEEINYTPYSTVGGINYGWKVMEGNYCHNNSNCNTNKFPCNDPIYAPPIFDYAHDESGGESVTGGMVYRGCDFPALHGKYICVDYASRNGWVITPQGSSTLFPTFIPTNISAFGEDERGELFCVGLSNGTVYRIIDSNVPLNKTLTGLVANTQLAADTLFVQAPISFTGDTLNLASRNIFLTGSQQINNNQHFKLKYTGGCND